MRRGRSGIGGWRNDNPRQFRPRGGGNPHFRPPSNIPPYESHGFQALGQRSHRDPYPFNTPDLYDRSKYRVNNLNNSRIEDRRHHSLSRPSFHHSLRQDDNFYEDVQTEQCLVNSMGDIDHRRLNNPRNQEPYGQHSSTLGPPPRINPWATPFDKPHFYIDQSPTKNYRHHEYNEGNKIIPSHDYTGHRPPSSDHYDATPGPLTNNNNTSFSRSVDDTVDIVRRRLLNRNDPQRLSEENAPGETHDEQDGENLNQITSQEPPTKKKIQKQRQNVKSNCDKMKKKIVHQLFKMDKDKIHKLMDNPSSSTKFEYAISSLITESQNSLNRHMRSVAEKSLYSSSTDFIHNDTNTIYEDTFMKQMQCILDPQDTVLLEDIKPIVMAELSKVLQLNDFEQRYDDHLFTYYDNFNPESYPIESSDGQNQFITSNLTYDDKPENFDLTNSNQMCDYNQQTESKPIIERRTTIGLSRDNITPSGQSVDSNVCASQRSVYTSGPDNRTQSEHSLEKKACANKKSTCTPGPDYIPRNEHSLDTNVCANRRSTHTPGPDYIAQSEHSLDRHASTFRRSTHTPGLEYITQSEHSLDRNRCANKRSIHEHSLDRNLHANKRSTCTPGPDGKEDRRNLPTQNDRRILRTPDRRILRTPDRRILRTPERRESNDQRTLLNSMKRESLDQSNFDILNEPKFSPPESVPLFESHAEHLSDDEDPFDELDRQYHVAVDHNFIENDDVPNMNTLTQETNNTEKQNIKKEVNDYMHPVGESILKEHKTKLEIKTQLAMSGDVTPDIAKENNTPPVNSSSNDIKIECSNQNREHATQSKKADKEISQNSSGIKTSTPPNSRKRSIDQRPSHRKEKRKKSEPSQPDTSKKILNKNIIINVNDCAVKSTEKCHDTPKSVFNLFFSKGGGSKETLKDNKNTDSSDKSYSDKYVKRKDNTKQAKENETTKKKRTSSTSSHSIVSPNDSQISNKQDAKTKLKTIDIFMEQPKKMTVHQAHRNTAVTTVPSAKTPDNKSKTLCISHKPASPVAYVAVLNKVLMKMHPKCTQTTESKKISRLSQTERKKLSAKWVQTDPVSLGKSITRSSDAFERMKEIDMEIQVLLQEKFKLYSSLETKESCHSTMPSLGMTVLSMTPNEEIDHENTISADDIVDDFTNIPVEELEQIALESVQEESDTSRTDKKNARQKLLHEGRKSSQSPNQRSNKKAKTPNISLIEQIITDDRPLEDIISLDDLEVPLVKTKKKPQRHKPKKKFTKKAKSVKSFDYNFYGIKECSVLLVQADLRQYLRKQTPDKMPGQSTASKVYMEFEVPAIENCTSIQTEPEHHEPEQHMPEQHKPETHKPEQHEPEQLELEQSTPTEIIEESVVNDLQFDMLDVSEDIVIGDMCEIKSTDERQDMHERVPICEEIILDNSQSSCDDVIPIDAGQVENICKTYDYSTDEKLRRDSVTVTGNADAVLAVECVENDFIAACLDGNVYHFNNDGQLLNTLRGSNLAVTCLTIVKEKYGTTVYTGSLDSRIRYYDLATGLEKGPECNVLSPIQTMDRAWDTIFVGTRTGFVLQFECKNNMLIPVSTVKFSDQSILALRALKEGPRKVLLVAARSESVTVKDAQTGLLLRTLVGPKMTVYTLLFEDGKVYCGTSSHQIHVFDYASGTHAACHEGGKGAVCLRASGGLLFAGCYDGCVYVYRDGDTRPMAQLRGPSPMLLSLAIVGTKIIAGYKDRSLYIWKLPLSILQEMIL